jgi:anhydro-N-acetylmuramic acid kinase
MLIAGIMTGTSLDAIDVAVCNVGYSEGALHITLVTHTQAPYPDSVLASVTAALAGTASMSELSALPFRLARAFADVVAGMDVKGLELLAVHGQTVWHEPPHSTWQMVSAPALASLSGVPVVADFRSADVALGGQGAPLVPVFDHATLVSDVPRVALNVGGMANITLLPANARREEVRAFDTGPGNVLIDAVCRMSFGKRFDDQGTFAESGVVIPRALSELKQHPFFSAEPPKSTGRELFGQVMAEDLWKRYSHPSIPAEDLVATLTELTAWSVTDHVQRYQPETRELVVSGGGAYNRFLLRRIEAMLPGIRVMTSSELGIPIAAKEAMAFAYLGWLTWHNLPGNLPSVTGASREAVLGSISKT